MILTLSVSMVAVLWAAFVFAPLCQDGQNRMIYCQIGGAKVLKVCVGNGNARCADDPRGAPERAITQPLSQIKSTPWHGLGRVFSEELTLKNNGIGYFVWTALDRLDESKPAKGDVALIKTNKTLARLRCRQGAAQITTFAVSEAFEKGGYRLDHDAGSYQNRCL